MPHVTASIVTWNSMKHLSDALASLAAQTFADLSVIIVDNASTDGSVEFVREHYPQAMVLRNTKNLGFARAHNQAITHALAHRGGEAEHYMLVMNPDTVLEPGFVAALVAEMEHHPEAGSASGLLYRMTSSPEGEIGGVKTEEIDSAGIQVTRSRRFTERASGERAGGRFVVTEPIFGPSGALALYRLSALEQVAYEHEFFDDDFFTYKEDVDLAWRLRVAGWSALLIPAAVAYHYRTAVGPRQQSNFAVLRNRLKKSATVNYLSYRNHFLLLMKNDRLLDGLLALPWILWYELRKFGIVLLFEPKSLAAIPSALRLLPRMYAKRRHLFSRAKTSPREIRKWFV